MRTCATLRGTNPKHIRNVIASFRPYNFHKVKKRAIDRTRKSNSAYDAAIRFQNNQLRMHTLIFSSILLFLFRRIQIYVIANALLNWLKAFFFLKWNAFVFVRSVFQTKVTNAINEWKQFSYRKLEVSTNVTVWLLTLEFSLINLSQVLLKTVLLQLMI